jgi:hypothetical protein
MKSLFFRCFILFSIFISTAQAASVYSVEVLVFSRDNTSTSVESWPELPLPSRGIELGQGSYQERSSSSFFLSNTSQRIRSAGGMRVIYHKVWSQPVINGRSSQPVTIQAGRIMEDGQYELSGTVTMDRGKYLHFKPDLQFRRSTGSGVIAAKISDPRRMKSLEAHYLDNPLFGIIVYARPLN